MIGDHIGVLVLSREKPGSLAVVSEIARRPYAIGVRKAAPELMAAVNAALRTLLPSGEIRTAATQAGFPYDAP